MMKVVAILHLLYIFYFRSKFAFNRLVYFSLSATSSSEIVLTSFTIASPSLPTE